jgi:hypothetical protein
MMVKMTRMAHDPNAELSFAPLRTTEVVGVTSKAPTVGQSFIVVSDSLEFEGGSRMVGTSPVKSVNWIGTDTCIFATASGSVYSIQIMAEDNVHAGF